MKTILATAYAINPYKGSEDGMGWNFVLQIARFNKVIAITRENNQPNIEKYKIENPNEIYKNIEFLYFDLPYWMRFWKKGGTAAIIYYLLWQRSIVSFIKKQHLSFDIVHNLNFHNDWTPSYLWKLNKPFVWGPIGHHPAIPKKFLKAYSLKYLLVDRATWLVKKTFWTFSFSLKKTVKNANHVLVMNHGVTKKLNLQNKPVSLIPSVATQDFGWLNNSINGNNQFTLISAGRLIPLKGFDLTIQSFSKFLQSIESDDKKKHCELVIVGSGPEKGLLMNLVKKNNITKNVKFIDWIDRNDLMKLFKNASAFLFPSHEGAGMVVAEALSFGLPVICLDNEGPGEFINYKCGFAASESSYQNTINQLAKSIEQLYENEEKRNEMRKEARLHFENFFDWNVRGEQLNKIYQSV